MYARFSFMSLTISCFAVLVNVYPCSGRISSTRRLDNVLLDLTGGWRVIECTCHRLAKVSINKKSSEIEDAKYIQSKKETNIID
ncbi:hypothetical protein Hdeb2414_s0004g00135181 [Helianthus debilis subsp. tardiflorus]